MYVFLNSLHKNTIDNIEFLCKLFEEEKIQIFFKCVATKYLYV